MKTLKEIEKSLQKKYRKEIFSKFIKAIKEFDLIEENDIIAVCISGGKDSFLLAKCMQELKRHNKFHFEVKYIVMDPGYSEEKLNQIKENAKYLNIDIEVFETNIFDVVKDSQSPCFLCARMRRGCLYSKAKELGCNKQAIEDVLLAKLYGNHHTIAHTLGTHVVVLHVGYVAHRVSYLEIALVGAADYIVEHFL